MVPPAAGARGAHQIAASSPSALPDPAALPPADAAARREDERRRQRRRATGRHRGAPSPLRRVPSMAYTSV